MNAIVLLFHSCDYKSYIEFSLKTQTICDELNDKSCLALGLKESNQVTIWWRNEIPDEIFNLVKKYYNDHNDKIINYAKPMQTYNIVSS